MKRIVAWLTASMMAVLFGTACEIYNEDDCGWWDECGDNCWGSCDDSWDDDWDADWDTGDGWYDYDDDEDYCYEKLDCLEECTAKFQDDGDALEAVFCYNRCFFSYDGCLPEEQRLDDTCDDHYNECMFGCYLELDCATVQMNCYLSCENDREECRGEDDGTGSGPDGNGDGTPSDPAPAPTCKDTYDECVDQCEWDQWMCHENCYEAYYGCMEAESEDEPPSDDGVC